MSGQLDLFGVRSTDPATSHAAARSMTGEAMGNQQLLVLSGVTGGGSTAYEVWSRLVGTTPKLLKENVVSKRMGELRAAGLLELNGETRPGSSGRQQQVHCLTERGAAVQDARRAA